MNKSYLHNQMGKGDHRKGNIHGKFDDKIYAQNSLMVIEEKNQHLSTESSLKAQQPEGQGRFPPDSCPAGREEQRGCALQGERRNEGTELHELGKLQTRGAGASRKRQGWRRGEPR